MHLFSWQRHILYTSGAKCLQLNYTGYFQWNITSSVCVSYLYIFNSFQQQIIGSTCNRLLVLMKCYLQWCFHADPCFLRKTGQSGHHLNHINSSCWQTNNEQNLIDHLSTKWQPFTWMNLAHPHPVPSRGWDVVAQLVERRPRDPMDSMTRGSNPIRSTRQICEFFGVKMLCWLVVSVPHPRVYMHA